MSLMLSVWQWLVLCAVAYTLYCIYDWWSRREWIPAIHNKAVLVTGCDSGFGAALAKSLYRRGVFVYAGCYTQSGAENLRQQTGNTCKTLILDVSDSDSVKQAHKYVTDTLPSGKQLWAVVNNAGVAGQAGPTEFITKQDVIDVLSVNVLGMMDVTNAFLPMLKSSKGRVVNMASIAAEFPFPTMSPYCISKHGAKAFSETLRVEKAMWGVSVSTVEPAFFKTNIVNVQDFTRRMEQKWPQLDARTQQEYGQDYIQRCIDAMNDVVNKGITVNLGGVVAAYEHALFSARPRAVYHPGYQAKILIFLKHTGLHWIIDYLNDKMAVKPQILMK